MSILNVILFYLLIINSNSISINYILKNNKDDLSKCYYAGPEGEATIEKCTAVTSTFQGPNRYESKCCLISYKIDPFY